MNPGRSPEEPSGAVLVTGATGFIGREVAKRLLATGRPVVALARARQGQSAADRVAVAVGLVPDGRRLDVIEADVAAPGFGLEPSRLRRLRETVQTVMHCAGDTSFFPDDLERFRSGHIDRPLELLRALGGGRLRRWAHLSTAYVCGTRSGTVLESEGDVGQGFHNPYERVKLESEATMRSAGLELDVDIRIVRPSIVVGAAPPTAGGNPSNLFFDLIRLAAALAGLSTGPIRLGLVPGARFNIVPVEYVAAAMVALAEHPGGARQTFHLVVPDAPTFETLVAAVTARVGLGGVSLVDPRAGPLSHPSPLEGQIARMLAGYRDYLDQDLRFDDAGARRLLDECGVPRPTLSGEAIGGLVDQALRNGSPGPAPVS